MTFREVMAELEKYGSKQTKKVLARHGAREPFFGVKIGDLKKIVRKIKKNHKLSLHLYETGNSDAMYLAGLIADENQITRQDLNDWVEKAYWYMLSEYAVAGVAAETGFGYELAKDWIRSDKPHVVAAGWSVLSKLVSIKPDQEFSTAEIRSLLEEIRGTIYKAPNRVRYTMNNFVIAAGSYLREMTGLAKEVGREVGTVHVDMGGTACKVPFAPLYIEKMEKTGRIGKKRKASRC